MATWLDPLEVDEISLVDKGANPGAVSVLMKRKEGEPMTEKLKAVLKAMGISDDLIAKFLPEEVMADSVEKQLAEQKEQIGKLLAAESLSSSIAKVSLALTKAKKKKEVDEMDKEVEKMDKNDPRVTVLKEMVTELLAKSAKHDAYSENLNGDEKTKFEAMPMSEKDDYMTANPVDDDDDDDSDDDGDDDGENKDGGKKGSKMQKAMQPLLKVNKALQARIEKMEEERGLETFWKSDLVALHKSGTMDTVGKALFKLRKADLESAETIITTLKALATQVEKAGLFKNIGEGGEAGDASAKARLDKMSEELAKKDGISVAKAMGSILDTEVGKALYAEIEAEKRK